MNSFDRTKFLDAMAYGVIHVKQRYPHIKYIFLSPDYRLYNGVGIDEYTNSAKLNVFDYYEAEKYNAELLNVPFVDSYNLSFRNAYTIERYTTDGVHFNAEGFSEYAQFLYYVLQLN